MTAINVLYEKYLECKNISTDTRKITPESIFFALKGPNFNANAFAEDALTAIQKLANHHRHQLNIPLIGITGSNGKTTTKELLNTVLSKKYKTLATVGNLNNQIGVPLTLLSIDKNIEIAVIEMGASKVGDIQELCEIAEPTHGLITNIGKAHIEGFGGFEGVIRGKSELYLSLIRSSGQVFINSRNSILKNMSSRFSNPLFYPEKGDYLECELLSVSPYVKYKHKNGETVETNLLGEYNYENICAALCVGKFFEVPAERANEAVRNYIPKNNRSQLMQVRSNTLILDAYNANPNSMRAAILNLKAMDHAKKAVILGDMYELGPSTEDEHKAIGALLSECNFDSVLLYGIFMKAAQQIYPEAEHFLEKDRLKQRLKEINFENTLILMKGSRGVGMDIFPLTYFLHWNLRSNI
jgi:UDP-N-acetylmuramoyl-tripeptide--D-alanyl-D-alanine ligase